MKVNQLKCEITNFSTPPRLMTSLLRSSWSTKPSTLSILMSCRYCSYICWELSWVDFKLFLLRFSDNLSSKSLIESALWQNDHCVFTKLTRDSSTRIGLILAKKTIKLSLSVKERDLCLPLISTQILKLPA